MADPPIIQRVELQGAEDAQRLLRQIGETGERAFERLGRAADSADLTRLDADKARQGIESLGRNIDQLIDRLQRMRDDVRRSGDAFSSATQRVQELPPALRLVSSASRNASRITTDGFNEATEAVRGTQQAAEGAAQGLQRTAQTADDVAVRVGLIAGAVAAVTAKVVDLGLQGVQALRNLPTAAQDAAAKIAGQAGKLNATTESYLRMAEAARQAGVSEEALVSGTADLRKVLDSIGQASERVAQRIETVGGGFTVIQRGSAKVEIADKRLHNLATALAGVGLNFADVSAAGTRMENVLGIVASKLAVLDEVSARTKLQALGKALGKDAGTVIPVIQNLVEAQKRYNSIVNESSDSTEGWLESFEKLAERGKAIREVTKGFGTGGVIDRLAEAKKAVDELGAATSGLANRIGALFVQGPALRVVWATKLADAVTALLFKFERLAEAQKEAFLQNLGGSPAELVFKTLIATSRALASLWNDVLVPAGKKLFEIFDNIAKSLGGGVRGTDIAGFFIAATIAVGGLVAALKLLQTAFSPVAAVGSSLIALAPLLAIVGAAAFLFWDEIKAGAEAAAGQLSEFQKAFRLLLRGDFSGAWKTFKDAAFAAIDAIWKKLSESPGVLGDLVRALGDAFRGLQTEEGKAALREFVGAVVELVKSIPPLVLQIAGVVAIMHRLRLITPTAIIFTFSETIRNLSLALAGIFGTIVALVTILGKLGVTAGGAIAFFARLVPIIALIKAAADPLIQLIVDLTRAIRKISAGDVLGGFRDAWMAVGRFVEGVIGNLILQINDLLEVVGTLGELALGALFRLLGIDVDKAKAAFVSLNAAIRELTGFDLFKQVTDAGKAWRQFADDIKNLGLAQAIVNEFKKLKIEIPEGSLLDIFIKALNVPGLRVHFNKIKDDFVNFFADIKKMGFGQAILNEFFKLRIEIPDDSLLGIIIKGFNSERFRNSLNEVKAAILEFIEAMKSDPLIATDWIPGVGPALRAIESLVTKINELLERRRQLNEQKSTPPILDVQPQSLKDSGDDSARVWKAAFNAEVSESEITLSDPETATFGKAGDLAASTYIDAFRKKMEGNAFFETTDVDKLFEVFDRTPASFQQQVREIVDLGQALRRLGQSGLAETLVRHLVHVADTLTRVEGSSADFQSAMETAQKAWQDFIDLLVIREEDPAEGLAQIKGGVEALIQTLDVASAKLKQLKGVRLAGAVPTPDTITPEVVDQPAVVERSRETGVRAGVALSEGTRAVVVEKSREIGAEAGAALSEGARAAVEQQRIPVQVFGARIVEQGTADGKQFGTNFAVAGKTAVEQGLAKVKIAGVSDEWMDPKEFISRRSELFHQLSAFEQQERRLRQQRGAGPFGPEQIAQLDEVREKINQTRESLLQLKTVNVDGFTEAIKGINLEGGRIDWAKFDKLFGRPVTAHEPETGKTFRQKNLEEELRLLEQSQRMWEARQAALAAGMPSGIRSDVKDLSQQIEQTKRLIAEQEKLRAQPAPQAEGFDATTNRNLREIPLILKQQAVAWDELRRERDLATRGITTLPDQADQLKAIRDEIDRVREANGQLRLNWQKTDEEIRKSAKKKPWLLHEPIRRPDEPIRLFEEPEKQKPLKPISELQQEGAEGGKVWTTSFNENVDPQITITPEDADVTDAGQQTAQTFSQAISEGLTIDPARLTEAGTAGAQGFSQSFTPALLTTMQSAVNSLMELLQSAFANIGPTIIQPIVDAFTGLQAQLAPLFAPIGQAVQQAFQTLPETLLPVFQQILTSVQLVANSITELFANTFANLTSIVQPGVDGMVSAFNTGIDQIIAKIDTAIARLQQLLALQQQGGGGGGDSPAPGFSSGGHFRGRSGRDTNLAWLTDNEYVIRVAAVKKYGVAMLDAINAGRFAGGGHVKQGLPAFQFGGSAKGSSGPNDEQVADRAAMKAAESIRQVIRDLAIRIGQDFESTWSRLDTIRQDISDLSQRMELGFGEIISWLREVYSRLVQRGAGEAEGHAAGGLFRGRPGKDTNLARLSDHEYVVRESAVRKYGVPLLDAINQGRLGQSLMAGLRGFDAGGLVSGLTEISVPRFEMGGMPQPVTARATRPLTLVLEGQRFPNLTGPAEVIDDLEKTAVRRRHASIGQSPSWRR